MAGSYLLDGVVTIVMLPGTMLPVEVPLLAGKYYQGDDDPNLFSLNAAINNA